MSKSFIAGLAEAMDRISEKNTKKHEVFTEIFISAEPSIIWEVLTDLEKYSLWNPFIVRSKGVAKVGEVLECHPRLPGSKSVHTFRPVVTRSEPPKEFAWKGHTFFPGFADGEHIFELIPQNGGVRLIHRQDFWGFAMPVLYRFMAGKTAAGFDLMNRALKERAEKAAVG